MKYWLIVFLATMAVSLNSYDKNRQMNSTSNIESHIDKFEEKLVVKNNNGWFHYFIPKGMADTLTVKMSCVFNGIQTHPPHIHNEDEAFFIIKGPVNFHINDTEQLLRTGDFIYTPSGSSHNIQRINNDTIKYLVIKREWLTSLEEPYKVGKANYTFEDCYFPYEKYNQSNISKTVLLDKDFSDGLQISMFKLPNGVSLSNSNIDLQQTAIYIIEGEAEITFDKQKEVVNENSTFYCPKGSTYILKNVGERPLRFLSVTTR